ncbi:ubiquinol-cytochrome c reductase iron-sulfur subunit [Falsirhodobacter sp. 20TX0035]|uniref:ubiquinol-cytochrome c reductase iron-sulfur subunit n=1 Tax=Falsirhodobacter sp. 20TX0035 TaxID=3022019 RepID=UPI00232E5E55|nr:ubiquinol-cytochrome c reductase iron-sulfur subunit [Falsirhodobacter sp. 20TX0035]MDB6452809.1 ubiquinol-cytochrome c reductase iron-sulfur subunit [Falsirhodobacter sp. 20TX0035]
MAETDDTGGSRREFLFYATGCAGCVATGAAVLPLIDQANPAADTRALSSVTVDVSGVEPGQQITVQWQGKPVFIRRRTAAEIAAARAVPLSDLPDPVAENANLPPDAAATDAHRSLDPAGEWLVMLGVCTHLGCVPLGDEAGDFGGWFCPCHGSHYDTAGRIRRGPATENLHIPVAEFVDATTLRLGTEG